MPASGFTNVRPCSAVEQFLTGTFSNVFDLDVNLYQEWPRQTKPKKGQFMNFSQGRSRTKVRHVNRTCFPKKKHQNSQKWAKFVNFSSFWPFLCFGLPGRLLNQAQINDSSEPIFGKGMRQSSFQWTKGFFSEKGGGNSVNQGFGKDFYRKGNSVKRFGLFTEPPDSENWKVAVLIPFPKNQLLILVHDENLQAWPHQGVDCVLRTFKQDPSKEAQVSFLFLRLFFALQGRYVLKIALEDALRKSPFYHSQSNPRIQEWHGYLSQDWPGRITCFVTGATIYRSLRALQARNRFYCRPKAQEKQHFGKSHFYCRRFFPGNTVTIILDNYPPLHPPGGRIRGP